MPRKNGMRRTDVDKGACQGIAIRVRADNELVAAWGITGGAVIVFDGRSHKLLREITSETVRNGRQICSYRDKHGCVAGDSVFVLAGVAKEIVADKPGVWCIDNLTGDRIF